MEEDKEKIIKAIEELGWRSSILREAFERRAGLYSRLNKILIISSTILSLVAAGSIGSSLTHLLDPKRMQILAVCAATAAAITSGLVSEFFSSNKVRQLFSISAHHLEIREAAKRVSLKPDLSKHALYARLDSLQKLYISVSRLSGEAEVTYPKKYRRYHYRSPTLQEDIAELKRDISIDTE